MSNDITNKANDYVYQLFKSSRMIEHYLMLLKPSLIYTQALAKKYYVNEEYCTLTTLFHEAGKISDSSNTDRQGAEIAIEFLNKNDYPKDKMMKVFNILINYSEPTTMEGKVSNTAEAVSKLIGPYHLLKSQKNNTLNQKLMGTEEELIKDFHRINFVDEKKICKPYYDMWRKIIKKGIDLSQTEYHNIDY